MRVTKVLYKLLVIFLVLTVATACRTVDETPPVRETPPPATPEPLPETPSGPSPITLQWAVWGSSAIPYCKALIAAYKEVAPHVTIELVDLGDVDWNVTIQTHLIGKHDYDLIMVRDIHGYEMHVSSDLLNPLDDLISSRGISLSEYKGIPEQFTMDGSLYALPFMCDFRVLFFNKDIFTDAEVDHPGNQMTFDDWIEIIKEITHGSGDNKVWGNSFDHHFSSIALFGILDGRHTVNDGSYEFMLPYYEAVLALEDGGYIPGIAGDESNRNQVNPFWRSGNIAQVNAGISSSVHALLTGVNWGIAAYPVPTPYDHGNTFGQVTQLAIPRLAKHPDEAMDFIAFISGKQGADIIASTGNIPVIMTDTALDTLIRAGRFPNDETTRGALQPAKIFLQQSPGKHAAEINSILNDIHLDIISREIDIDEGIILMNEKVSALLR